MLLSRGKTKSDLYTCMHGKGTHPGARHVRSRVRRFGSRRNKFTVFSVHVWLLGTIVF
jgi:hypothetical protein